MNRRLLAILLFILPWRTEAHLTVQTNVFLDLELMNDRVALELWIPTFYFAPLEDDTFESPEPLPDGDDRQKAIVEFIGEKCPVKMDGEVVAPEFESLEYARVEQGLHLGLLTDFVHAKMRINFPFDEMPRQISMVWGIFVPEPEFGWDAIWDGQGDPQELQLVFVHGRTPVPVFFSPVEPEFIWHAPLEGGDLFVGSVQTDGSTVTVIPAVSVALVVAALLFLAATVRVADFTAVRVIVTGALVAGAVFFHSAGVLEIGGEDEFSKEDAVVLFGEKLEAAFLSDDASGVAEPLRERVKREVGQSMIMHDQGGAVASPSELSIQSVEVTKAEGRERGYDVNARWQILGEVDHWEHSHSFAKEFEGSFLLAPVGGDWLICAVDVKSEQRLDSESLEPVIPRVGVDPGLELE